MQHSSYEGLERSLAGNSALGQLKRDREKCLAMLRTRPDDPVSLRLIGVIESRLNSLLLDLASKWFKNSLIDKPDSPELHCSYAEILATQRKYPESIAAFRRSISLRPDYAKAHYGLGTVFMRGNDDANAIKSFNDSLAADPNCPDTLNNLGVVLYNRGEFAQSVSLFKKALHFQHNSPEALNNLGNALKDTGDLPEAIASYKRAISLSGKVPDYHNNLATALLAAGRFEEGWHEYEWRWQSGQLSDVRKNMEKPLWKGEAAEGRILLIRAEQGFGDTLQFCRYAPLAAAGGLRVVLEVPSALVKLLDSLAGVEKVITAGEPLPDFDLYCPMMSLPAAFNTRLETIPGAVPYLSPDDACVNAWRARLAGNAGKRLKVGLTWAGKPRFNSPDLMAVDRRRSIAPNILAPLMNIPGLQFYSLQKGGPAAPAEFDLIDLMKHCGDFADTAGLIVNLDLVISVDTAVAHLAGALGKPVWLLNRFDSCWRWLQTREDSPWYPTLRLFRQRSPGDWESVVSHVKKELRAFVVDARAKPKNPGGELLREEAHSPG